ncbi:MULTISPECIES: DUF421 domain-containing protein [Aeribacillus]|jgi:uncharacterized membrane protein YcaP (DUF421 family)|uniref:YetF C-terminal domain-containing protein n=2 Tax=Aeribacillus TaxID=1055323 RepID=A0A164BST9_9BACI|nr:MULTISPECIES: DUF421 domain-containing protein [Aeribacillus]ASS91053.1 hypothetical protein AP3564_13190 [Aeribacillus pallidus]KZM57743.1 hypothetical protein A3Q35_04270 [Aeribacillus pallidus]MDR9793480.1 DUF421 domain-containing protein [Aeribacillus pallidus]MDR9794929.1 DUF421 domain-containing protein [Aeribacillus pallidus]MED0649431.1 DUF421 domain-containing protein [Aeribacillus composti]
MPEWVEVIIRSLAIIAGLFFISKLLGKKQLSKLSFFEYVVGITIGDIAGTLSMDTNLNLTNGIISIAIWVMIPVIISFISMKSPSFQQFIEGKPTVFIKNGKIMEENLKKEKYPLAALLEQLRKNNVHHASDVEFAILETTGELSILLKKEKQPITVGDIKTNVAPVKEPQTVIMDGKIMDEALSTTGLNRRWLKEKLDQLGVAVENVFLAQVDSYGQLTVDLYDDKVKVPEPVEKQLLLSSLKKVEADFELYALQTENTEAKNMYIKNRKKIAEMIKTLTPFLQG